MNKTDAAHLARTLMNQHGLGHIAFEFDRGKRRLGATHFILGFPTKITLSAHFVELLPEDEIRNTILHEIAHALAGHAAGHGPQWRAVARKVGAVPKACATPSATPAGKYELRCEAGHTFAAHRLPKRVKSCVKCLPYFSVKHLLVLHEKGKPVPRERFSLDYRREFDRLELRKKAGMR